MKLGLGKRIWVFADGDLPPRGDHEPFGHEALMVVNTGCENAQITMDLLFESSSPEEGIVLNVPAKRVCCFRMDHPLGEKKYQIQPGQFAVVLKSSVPVVAVYGRLDRRKDMAYYPVAGFSE